MRVSILSPITMSDAGAAVVLRVGQVYDLPLPVAHGFIARGLAALVSEPAARVVSAVVPPETGQRRRRGRA